MKYILIIAALLMLGGCEGKSNAEIAIHYSEHGQKIMDRAGEVCKNWVVYYFVAYDRGGMLAPAFNQDSTVKTCK